MSFRVVVQGGRGTGAGGGGGLRVLVQGVGMRAEGVRGKGSVTTHLDGSDGHGHVGAPHEVIVELLHNRGVVRAYETSDEGRKHERVRALRAVDDARVRRGR